MSVLCSLVQNIHTGQVDSKHVHVYNAVCVLTAEITNQLCMQHIAPDTQNNSTSGSGSGDLGEWHAPILPFCFV